MEAKFGEKGPQILGAASEMKAVGKKKIEWDLNNWRWDGDLFRAAPFSSAPAPLNSVPAQLNSVSADCGSRQLVCSGSGMPFGMSTSNSSSSCSDEANMQNERATRELEKRRRVVVIEEQELNEGGGSPSLRLGGQPYPIIEGETAEKNGKESKVARISTNRAVCQVKDCRADLSNAKDYHRRHKVCDVHSKANSALVGNVMQRFCQQCSRFHVLQEFDEGKRSCRRRLAGHNRRRRKTHLENAVSGISVNDERSSSYLLISLLRILSNIQTNSTDQTNDKDLLSHLLTNLASVAGTANQRNCGLLNESQDLQDAGESIRIQGQDPSRPTGDKREIVDVAHGGVLPTQQANVPTPMQNGTQTKENELHTSVQRKKINNFDLNNAYDDSEDCMEISGNSDAPVNVVTHQDSHKATPPQTSGNSGSISTQSPSCSSGEALSRTDRIVFKLFGHDPSRIPLNLRSQILAWLAFTPTEIESYIRPGCIILTVYLRMEKSAWEKLCCDLRFSLTKLLDSSSDSFWKTGWIYARVQHHVAFVYSGQVVLDIPLPLKNDKNCKILSIKPIAVPVSEAARFQVKGFNISRSNTRLLCALEGKYLVQQNCSSLMDGTGSLSVHEEEVHSISLPCSIPDVIGRGFIEVEDHSLSSSFFPFIVAEQDVCSEICTLESAIECAKAAGVVGGSGESEASTVALDFVHEFGWLLHRHQLKFRLGTMDPNTNLFSFRRFRCIMEFSLDHDWCAVVKKLLDILFDGIVDAGEHPSVELSLLEIGPLHRAVCRNCRPMVEALLCYHPETIIDKCVSDQKQNFEGPYLFRPDAVGPGGLTPLHVAASKDGSESVLDALTDDPQSVGIEAWRTARDSLGFTPHDYAHQRGYYSYIHMVQTKMNMKSERHVAVNIPSSLLDYSMNMPKCAGVRSMEHGSLETEKTTMTRVEEDCNLCNKKLGFGNICRIRAAIAYCRPAVFSMIAIAAVCVCVALLFKTSPEVLFVFVPFRWEYVRFGAS